MTKYLLLLSAFTLISTVQAKAETQPVQGVCTIVPDVAPPSNLGIEFYDLAAYAKMPMEKLTYQGLQNACHTFGALFSRAGLGRGQNYKLVLVTNGKVVELDLE